MAKYKEELYEAAEYALEALKKAGADGAEVMVSRTNIDELNVDAGEFSLMRSTLGASFRVDAYIGGRYGVATNNRFERETVDSTVASAIDAAQNSEIDDANFIPPGIGKVEWSSGVLEPDLEKLFDLKKSFMDQVHIEYPKIDIMQFVSKFRLTEYLYANSNGTRAFRETGVYDSGATFSARDGENVTSMYGIGTQFTDPGKQLLSYDFARRALNEMEPQLNTIPLAGKFVGKLLCSPDCTLELIDSALGSTVDDMSLIQGTSPWKDKMGGKVADSKLSLWTDPNDERIMGQPKVDDGYLTERHDIITNGVLKGWLLDRYGAKKTGLDRAKYGGSVIIGLGDKTLDELIAGIDEGILMNRFSGGSPAQNGDFSGVAKNSFLIKNGKITDAVSETMVSGNIFELLNNIVAIGKDYQNDGASVAPYMTFDGVTISGK